MEYKLLRSELPNELSERVNSFLKQGWKPHGLPFATSSGNERQYNYLYQAVIKESTEPAGEFIPA